MKKMALISAVLSLSAFVFTSIAVTHAQPFGKGKHNKAGAGLTKLLLKFDLSSEQKTAIANSIKSHQDQLQSSHEAVREARKEMHQATMAEKLDEAAVSAAAQKLGTALGKQAILRAKMRAATLSALTPEQRNELKAEREKRKEKHEKRREKREKREKRGPNLVEQWVERHSSS